MRLPIMEYHLLLFSSALYDIFSFFIKKICFLPFHTQKKLIFVQSEKSDSVTFNKAKKLIVSDTFL